MADPFESHQPGLTASGYRHYLIAPDDDNDLPFRPRAIYCRVAGDIVMRDEADQDLTYTMEVGDVLDFRPVRVMATDTTGTFYAWY